MLVTASGGLTSSSLAPRHIPGGFPLGFRWFFLSLVQHSPPSLPPNMKCYNSPQPLCRGSFLHILRSLLIYFCLALLPKLHPPLHFQAAFAWISCRHLKRTKFKLNSLSFPCLSLLGNFASQEIILYSSSSPSPPHSVVLTEHIWLWAFGKAFCAKNVLH